MGDIELDYIFCRCFYLAGSIVGSDKTHEGKLEIPNLSEENESQDLIINVTANTSKDEAYEVKEFMRKVGTSKIQDQLGLYMEQLKKGLFISFAAIQYFIISSW